MIIDFHNLNGGGGGGTAEYATSAGTSNKSKLLLSESNFPQSANTGDVVAIGSTPTRGLKSGTKAPLPSTGIYQYDGSSWNKIETETPDFTALKPVSELPLSGETGEVIAFAEHVEGLPYGITFDERDYNGGDIQGRRLIIPFGCLDGLEIGDMVFLGNVGPVGGSLDELNLTKDEFDYHFTYEDPNDPNVSLYMDEEGNGQGIYSSNSVVFELYISGDTYVIDIYPDVNDINEIVFTNVPEDSDILGVYQYDGSGWNQVGENGGGSSSAYKIELSTNIPDEFEEMDIDNLNEFFDAVEADPSIKDSAYILFGNEIYRSILSYYDSENHYGDFVFSIAYADYIDQIMLQFEDGEYTHGEHHVDYDNLLWPIGDELPENIADGGVYPVHIDPQDYQIGDDWTDTESTTPIWGEDWHDSPQAIRVQSDSGNGDKFSIYFNCSNYGTEETIAIDKDGYLEMNANTCKKISDNYWVFDDPAWYPYLDGEKLYAVYEAPYVYIFTTNREKIWLNYVTNNYVNNNVYTGEVTPPQPAKNDVYQYVSNEVPIVEVYGEGDYEDSIGQGSNSFAISSGGTLCIKINDVDAFNEAVEGGNWTFCTYEANKEYAPIMWNPSGQTWDFYDDDGETVLESVADGDTGSFTEFDSETLYFSFEGGILKLWVDNEKTFYDFDIPEGSAIIDASEKLAKDKDIQAMTPRLLPKANEDGSIPVYSSYQSGWTTTNRGAIVVDGMREGYEYEEPLDGQPMALVRESYWGCGWQPTFKMVKITQADYDDLVLNDEVDPKTMYLIINPQV